MFGLRRKCRDVQGMKIKEGWYFDPLNGYVLFNYQSAGSWMVECSDFHSETHELLYPPLDTSRCVRVEGSPAIRHAKSNFGWLEKRLKELAEPDS